MLGDEQQRLLAAHAAADRVDPVRLDPQPGQRLAGDAGHAREVGDLSRGSPRIGVLRVPLTLRVHDSEATQRRHVPPQPRIGARLDPAPVRRDHERDQRVISRSVPTRQNDDRDPARTVVGAVVHRPAPDEANAARQRRPVAAAPARKRRQLPRRARVHRRRRPRAEQEHRGGRDREAGGGGDECRRECPSSEPAIEFARTGVVASHYPPRMRPRV